MKFLILDVYPSRNIRIVKDTAGGYGTGNDFGKNFFSKILNYFTSKMIAMPPMYAMYVFSILKKKQIIVEYDTKIDSKKINEFDYVIIPSSIVAHESEIAAITQLNKLNKKIFVIGVFAEAVRDKYKIGNTYIVKGEPENFFLNLDFDKDNLDKFFDKKYNPTVNGGFVKNLDELPFPDWKYYLKKHSLKNNFLGFNSKTAIPILATRGCPYSCFNYCVYPLQQGRKVRFRSINNIIEEIKFCLENLKTNKFTFRDPVFSINRKFTYDLCKEIIAQGIKIEFLIETHLKNLDDELISILKKAGLKLVYVGIESSSATVLNDINRATISNDEQFEKIKKMEAEGIFVKTMFMLGNPSDDIDSLKNTIDYAKKLPNNLAQFSVFTPYPGTPIYKNFEKTITADRFEYFNQYKLVYKHKNITSLDLDKLKGLAYRKYYMNFKRAPVIIKSLLSFLYR